MWVWLKISRARLGFSLLFHLPGAMLVHVFEPQPWTTSMVSLHQEVSCGLVRLLGRLEGHLGPVNAPTPKPSRQAHREVSRWPDRFAATNSQIEPRRS